MEKKTYYHVAPETYNGGDLLCRDELEYRGILFAHKWDMAPEDYSDGDLVCLFETLEDAQDYLWEFEPNGKILQIQMYPEDRLVRNYEGYLCVSGSIAEDRISEITEEVTA